jgi:hypothetical protein
VRWTVVRSEGFHDADVSTSANQTGIARSALPNGSRDGLEMELLLREELGGDGMNQVAGDHVVTQSYSTFASSVVPAPSS